MMRHTRLLCPVLVALVTLTSLGVATENTKRAPSGFQGVRGKKSIPDTYPESDGDGSGGQADKRAPSAGFHGMRGKKLLYPLAPLEPSYTGYPELMFVPKRAPMGFVGMRGKKEMEFVGDDLEQKRAPNMGFLGMRGKKLIDDDEDDRGYNDYFMEKRAPMGFLGMRGKKEYSMLMEEEKRAPSDGFFGMRGKKQPGRSSFFGMRGKKYPYEFRGKFVGVRGKKDSSENALPELEAGGPDSYADLDLNELMVLLAADGGAADGPAWDKRKGPSGFLGMRG